MEKKLGFQIKVMKNIYFFLFWIDKSAPREKAWGHGAGTDKLYRTSIVPKNAWSTLLTFFAFFCTAYLQTRTRKFREFGWLTQGEHHEEVADLGYEVEIYTLS